MTRPLRRLLLFLGVGVSALIAAGAVLVLAVGEAKPLPLPNPNGYDDLTQAGHIATRRVDYSADLDRDGLRALLRANTEALGLLRLGLTRGCAVPTDVRISNFGSMSGELIELKSLARLLVLEGRLAEIENDPTDAAKSYVDAIRLGIEMSRGGLMINRLVGIACEGVGSTALVALLPKLTCGPIRPLVIDLEQIDESSVTWQEILKNENRFVRAQSGKYPNPIKLASDLWQARKVRKASQEKHELALAHLRLLSTELALRCYRCDQERAAQNLQQLVPKYLKRVPTDPFSGHPLIFRQQGTNWLLYSVGPDRVDDGGRPISRITSGGPVIGLAANESVAAKGTTGDLLYDSSW